MSYHRTAPKLGHSVKQTDPAMWREIGLGKGGIDKKFVIVFEKHIVETCTRTLRSSQGATIYEEEL
jgi:hypothetical protein